MIHHVLLVISIIFQSSYCTNVVFWHICDIHLNVSSHSLDERFGNYLSDSPLPLVKSAIDNMKLLYSKPDFIIWNGDNAAHGKIDNKTFISALNNVTQYLRSRFPSTNILPSLGNHDLNPSNNIHDGSKWCESLFEHWKVFFSNNSNEINTFKRGCYYSRVFEQFNTSLKVIVLNTVIWYSANRLVNDLTDPFEQFKWMKEELEHARKNGTKVFIVGHVPPGASEYTPSKYKHLYPEFNKQLVEILQNNHDIIEAGFFSHQHTDSFKIVYNATGGPVIPLFLSPSVTPLYLSGLGSVNPSIRLYNWSMNSSSRFYSQYHALLPDKGNSRQLNWFLEYNSKQFLPSLSASNLDSLLKTFSLTDSALFPFYFSFHLSGRNHTNNERCLWNSTCHCRILCGMKYLLYADLDKCLVPCNKLRDVTVKKKLSPAPLIVSVIVVFTLILIATVVGVNKVYCHRRRTASLSRDIYMATYSGKDCEQVVEDHAERIAEITFGDVPEYRGHMRNNSRTILTHNDGNEVADAKSEQSVSKFAISKKSKSQEKYDYSRM